MKTCVKFVGLEKNETEKATTCYSIRSICRSERVFFPERVFRFSFFDANQPNMESLGERSFICSSFFLVRLPHISCHISTDAIYELGMPVDSIEHTHLQATTISWRMLQRYSCVFELFQNARKIKTEMETAARQPTHESNALKRIPRECSIVREWTTHQTFSFIFRSTSSPNSESLETTLGKKQRFNSNAETKQQQQPPESEKKKRKQKNASRTHSNRGTGGNGVLSSRKSLLGHPQTVTGDTQCSLFITYNTIRLRALLMCAAAVATRFSNVHVA